MERAIDDSLVSVPIEGRKSTRNLTDKCIAPLVLKHSDDSVVCENIRYASRRNPVVATCLGFHLNEDRRPETTIKTSRWSNYH